MASECTHNEVFFGSGGYYVFCSSCQACWVAKKGERDDAFDYQRKAEGKRSEMAAAVADVTEMRRENAALAAELAAAKGRIVEIAAACGLLEEAQAHPNVGALALAAAKTLHDGAAHLMAQAKQAREDCNRNAAECHSLAAELARVRGELERERERRMSGRFAEDETCSPEVDELTSARAAGGGA